MENKDQKQNEQKLVGDNCYLNKNCWLVKNLNYSPYKRCQYCDFKFHKCLFLHYQVISLALITLCISLFWIFDKRVSTISIVVIFILVIVYGYFFNNSTEKIVRASFFEKKMKEELKDLSQDLEKKVDEQTRDIKKKNQYLEELLNMKGDFLRIVNHQLNTPLSIMRNAFSMMEDGSLPRDKGMEIANNGLVRMASTISDFWDAFELEGQKIKMNIEPIDIEKVVDQLIEEKKHLKLAIDRKLEISVDKPSFKIPLVLCDPKKMLHVISNLLDNAIFYTAQGSVTVRYEISEKNKKSFLKVLVCDTGSGISPEDQKRLFTKFHRGSSASGLNPNGSGLGLYIAKRILEDCSGKLGLEESIPGKGTKFGFCLPVAKESEASLSKVDAKKKEKQEKKESKITKRSILLIEDEVNIVDLYKIYFENKGYEFSSTQDLDEAINIVKKKKIDVVLLDIIIPEKEKDGAINVVSEQGYVFLERLKKEKLASRTKVIMFTNLNTEKDKKKAMDLGASGYIFKGGTAPSDLLKEIDKILTNKKA